MIPENDNSTKEAASLHEVDIPREPEPRANEASDAVGGAERWAVCCMDIRGKWWVMTSMGWEGVEAKRDGGIEPHERIEAGKSIPAPRLKAPVKTDNVAITGLKLAGIGGRGIAALLPK